MLNLRETSTARAQIGAPNYSACRSEALAVAEQLGLPSRRVEAWHYTDLARLLKQGPSAPLSAPADLLQLSPYVIVSDDDGVHLPERLLQDPAITVTSIFDRAPEQWAPMLTASDHRVALDAYNLALLEGGVYVTVTGRPQFPVCFSYRGNSDRVLRHIIRLEKGAELTLCEHYAATQLCHTSVNIDLEEGASLEHMILHENGAVLTVNQAHLAGSARVNRHYLAYAPHMARHETHAYMDAPDARFDLTGTLLLGQSAQCDVTSVLEHRSPHSNSNTLVRSVLTDDAHGIFQGKILVHRDAQHIDAQQAAHTLLSSETAQMSVKPELEIFADDVACSHGATIGEVDPDALFFLRSRGVPEPQAREMLISGFMSVGLSRVRDENLRNFMQELVTRRIERMVHRGPLQSQGV